MTSEEYAEAMQPLWTKALTELAGMGREVWYHENIVKEIKECIEWQVNSELLPGPDDGPVIAKLVDITATLAQYLAYEKAWFSTMMADQFIHVEGMTKETPNGI